MATEQEQKQATRRLEIHKKNLARLEEQKAKLAGAVNLAIDNQIDEERANIALLEPIANPPAKPSPKVAEFARAAAPDIDMVMLYLQGVQANARLTNVEEKIETVVQAQGAAQLWRLDIAGRLEDSDHARVHGQKRNFLISVGNIALLLVLALALWFVLARAGLL
jgi:hypothetical protein